MTIPDVINGLFESTGAVAGLLNITRLYRDKQVKGFHFLTVLFFTSWGIWNLYYYHHHLGQYVSWIGGALLCLTNLVYTTMTLYYLSKEGDSV